VSALHSLTIDPRPALAGALRATSAFVGGLDDAGWARATRCSEWTVRDLLYHQLLDAQRALRAFASPSDLSSDVDYITYWRTYGPDQSAEDARSHALFVRESAAAFRNPESLRWLWNETAESALRAASMVSLDSRVTTQELVLTNRDFISTLAVEAAIHHLDFLNGAYAAPSELAGALELTALTLDGILGARRPMPWSDEEYLLRGTGREPLSRRERTQLGQLAARFPLIT